MLDILNALLDRLAEGEQALHCQIVETRGSTPQKAGARMLVFPDGRQVGTLGGGCVEAEVKQKAIRLLDHPGAETHEFILDHDYAWADGLICGGRMLILAECLVAGDPSRFYFESLRKLVLKGRGHTEAIVADATRAQIELGARVAFGPDNKAVATFGLEGSNGEKLGVPPSLDTRPRPSVRGGIAFLPTLPRVRLVIVGAGHVGQAVADLAADADFDVEVVDDRRQYANPERFPKARKLVVGPLDEILPTLEMDGNTYALIVTRGHGHDQEALYHIAPTEAAYVGLIGSRRKIRMIFEALRESNVDGQKLARVAAPVGLNIGSQTVVEIAISIVAELIAIRNVGRAPGRTGAEV
jgi:xanthine dehydrogenase accessory factor